MGRRAAGSQHSDAPLSSGEVWDTPWYPALGTGPRGGTGEHGTAGTKRPRAHLDSFGWALQGTLNPASRSPRLSPSPRRGAEKAALPRMFFHHPGSPPAPSIPGRPQPSPPITPRAGQGAPPGKGPPQAHLAGSGRGSSSPRRQRPCPAAAPRPAPGRASAAAPCASPSSADKGAMPAAGAGGRRRAPRPGRARSGSAAAGGSSAPAPRLGAAPAGPQPGSPPHPSAGLGRAAGWAGLGWAGLGGQGERGALRPRPGSG